MIPGCGLVGRLYPGQSWWGAHPGSRFRGELSGSVDVAPRGRVHRTWIAVDGARYTGRTLDSIGHFVSRHCFAVGHAGVVWY
jgi:hypothetical protein